jgi:ABC-type multidrug transport system fused ATPase/permease subunit
MNKLKAVFSFGAPYLARYWRRLVLGILLGISFGLVNASFVWATRTTFGRLDPSTQTTSQSSEDGPPVSFNQKVKAKVKAIGRSVDNAVDPWLPARGRRLDWRQVIGGMFLLPFLVALRGIVSYLSTYCLSWVSERAMSELRIDVLTKMSSLSMDFFHRSKTGDLLQRVNADTMVLQQSLSVGFSDIVKESITITCLLATMLIISAKLTLFAMCFMPLCLIPIVVLGKKVRKTGRESHKTQVQQMSLLVEAISGIRVIKAFGLEQQQLGRFREICRELTRHGVKGVQAKAMVNPLIEFIALSGMGGMIVYIAYTNLALKDLLGFMIGAVLLFEPIKKLANVHVMFEQASIGVERLMQLLAEQPTVKEPANPKPFQQFKDSIVFENVSFAYGEKPVLQDINITIPRGCKLGIAGESGAGKSTMVNLLMRFYDPTHGSIKIDEVDIREMSFADLRGAMALVSQEIVLFDQSAAANIACGKRGATRAEVEEAAQAASAHDFIMRLPKGYDSVIGERGQSLSGGQRQRIAIARAFVRKAPILMLDEATASLDSHAEMEVQSAIERLEKNKTVLCVAHRFATLMEMDHIIVLSREGRIAEQGTFDELLRASGVFAGMARRQGFQSSMQSVA